VVDHQLLGIVGHPSTNASVHDDPVVLMDPGEPPDDRDLDVPYGLEAAIRHAGRLAAASDDL
jgi:hypothetical protein